MIASFVFAVALLQRQSQATAEPMPGPTIVVGWQDELDSPSRWEPLAMENQARVIAPPGVLILSLGHVPDNWPYTYQWSGVTQDASVDVARFPVLMAKVNWVQGYAHMDIDVLDAQDRAVKTLRSSTLNGQGISTVDLVGSLDPAYYRLRLRLIVGGDNAGCAAIYDWVRFVGKKDAEFLAKNPDWTKLRLAGAIDR